MGAARSCQAAPRGCSQLGRGAGHPPWSLPGTYMSLTLITRLSLEGSIQKGARG